MQRAQVVTLEIGAQDRFLGSRKIANALSEHCGREISGLRSYRRLTGKLEVGSQMSGLAVAMKSAKGASIHAAKSTH
jgi:hypothetical protein